MISVTCECGKSLLGPPESAGKRGRCPGCGKVMRMPLVSAPVAPAREARRPEPEPESLPLPKPVHEAAEETAGSAGGASASPFARARRSKVEDEPVKRSFSLGTFAGINLSIPTLVGLVMVVVVGVLVTNWYRGLTAHFVVNDARAVDVVVVTKGVLFKAQNQFILGARNHGPEYIKDPVKGEIVMGGPDLVVLTHGAPKGEYLMVRAEISQQILSEEKQEADYDIAFRQSSFKIIAGSQTIEPWLIVTGVGSGLELPAGEAVTTNPDEFLPFTTPPDKKQMKKDDRGRNLSGTYEYTGTNGLTGKFVYQCFYFKSEQFGERSGMSGQGVIDYQSPTGMQVKYDYSGGLKVDWPSGVEGWVTKSSYLRGDGGSMFARHPIVFLFPKPKDTSSVVLMLNARKLYTFNVEKISVSTPETPTGTIGAPGVPGTPGKVAKSGKGSKKKSSKSTKSTDAGDAPEAPAAGTGSGGGASEAPAAAPAPAPKDDGVTDPLSSYLMAVVRAKKKAMGVVSDLNMAELAKAIFMYVETNNGKWPANLDEVDKVYPGTKALASKSPRPGNEGYIYVQPNEELGKMKNADKVAFIFESKGGQIDKSGNACFADGHVGRAPP